MAKYDYSGPTTSRPCGCGSTLTIKCTVNWIGPHMWEITDTHSRTRRVRGRTVKCDCGRPHTGGVQQWCGEPYLYAHLDSPEIRAFEAAKACRRAGDRFRAHVQALMPHMQDLSEAEQQEIVREIVGAVFAIVDTARGHGGNFHFNGR